MKRIYTLLILFLLFFSQIKFPAFPKQISSLRLIKENAPKIFLNCQRCDIDYIKTEITFVNYVWDPKEADVYILITTLRTGSGGREFTIAFIGQGEFSDLKSELKFYTKPTDTEEEVRRGLVHFIKLGLTPFVARTPVGKYISITFTKKVKPTAVKDPWRFWVFSTSMNFRLSGEKRMKFNSIWANFSANKVTPEIKIRFGLSGNFREEKFSFSDRQIYSSTKRGSVNFLIVKSLGEHWSLGGWGLIHTSTYSNIKLGVELLPAIEYNFFPYSESTRHQLRILYKIGFTHYNYYEETIYDKISENLMKHALSITLEMIERWGDVEISLEGSHYLHDFKKNRLRLFTDISLRIFKGLFFNIFGSYSAIHDQIYLPKGEATLEEVLLRRKELESNYRFRISFGLQYRFGSIYSNVVNPRFGDAWRYF